MNKQKSYRSVNSVLWLGYVFFLMADTHLSGQNLPSWIDQEVVATAPTTIDNYKAIHQSPELGKAEFKTAASLSRVAHLKCNGSR